MARLDALEPVQSCRPGGRVATNEHERAWYPSQARSSYSPAIPRRRYDLPRNATTNPGQSLQLFDATPATRPQEAVTHDDVQIVWEHYAKRHRTARLDAKRARCITDRFKDGYSVADMCRAIDGCHQDPWYAGENDRGKSYCELTLILRDADHVDRFIRLADEPRLPVSVSGRDVSRMAGGSSQTRVSAMAAVTQAAAR